MDDQTKNQGKIASGARFHEAFAHGWSDGYQRGGFRRRLDLVESRLRRLVEPGARWLDVGCGSGVLTRCLSDLGAVGDAIDGSPAMIDAARAAAVGTSFQYERVETIESIPKPAASYDGALCSSVIEYVEQPGAALDEIARVLRPGAHLLISVAGRYSPVRFVQRVARRAGQMVGRDLYAYLDVSRTTYSRRDIVAALERRRFVVEEVTGFDPVIRGRLADVLSPSLIFVTAKKIATP